MTKKPAKGQCPICARPMVAEHRPFCSARCADVDLNRWLGGVYAVPGKDGEAANDPEGRDLGDDDRA